MQVSKSNTCLTFLTSSSLFGVHLIGGFGNEAGIGGSKHFELAKQGELLAEVLGDSLELIMGIGEDDDPFFFLIWEPGFWPGFWGVWKSWEGLWVLDFGVWGLACCPDAGYCWWRCFWPEGDVLGRFVPGLILEFGVTMVQIHIEVKLNADKVVEDVLLSLSLTGWTRFFQIPFFVSVMVKLGSTGLGFDFGLKSQLYCGVIARIPTTKVGRFFWSGLSLRVLPELGDF